MWLMSAPFCLSKSEPFADFCSVIFNGDSFPLLAALDCEAEQPGIVVPHTHARQSIPTISPDFFHSPATLTTAKNESSVCLNCHPFHIHNLSFRADERFQAPLFRPRIRIFVSSVAQLHHLSLVKKRRVFPYAGYWRK